MEGNRITYMECNSDSYIGDSIEKTEKDYTIDQCVLIRTTNIFPFNKIIETPINGNAYEFGESTLIGDTIKDKIKKQINFEKTFDIDKLTEESNKYKVCFETLRTTIHFTINGLVSSHAFGNFEARDYIIIEPLKYHINDNSLLALRAEDTYFNDNMQLSDEAAIIISEDKFNQIKEIPEYISTLEKFNIFIYKGKNQKEAVQKTLKHLGYDNFNVNEHGYTNGISNGTAAQKMYNFLNLLRNKYNIGSEKHFYSEVNNQDRNNRMELASKIDMEHLIYIINNATTVPQEIKEKVINLVSDEYTLKSIIPEIVDVITLEEIERLTGEFNQIYINNLNERKNNNNKISL